MTNSGIYITLDGIVGYTLLNKFEIDNPRKEFGNICNICAFNPDEGDYLFDTYEIFKEMSTIEEKKEFIINKFKNKKIIKGIKDNLETNNLELCEIEEADYGLILANKSYSEKFIIAQMEKELKDYTCYLEGKQYIAIKYSFLGEPIEFFKDLYGKDPIDSGVFMTLGYPVSETSLADFELDNVNVENIIRKEVFLKDDLLYNFFKKNLQHEDIMENITEFNIDLKKEIFNKNDFVQEILDYLNSLSREKRKKSNCLKLISDFLIEKAFSTYDKLYFYL